LLEQIDISTVRLKKGKKIGLYKSRLQKVNFSVRGQANERCDGCNYLKSLAVRLSPQAVICEFRLFAGDSIKY